ncbi:uncharacterized protein LOC128876750 [Hylaeus volcanicus]|uniref:uncharacterized protein LOC128876750 n=1 Tax=Hylaeus volcanicus TaxID=313075 RepID=UPI0023B85F89|nr:uncharacterized protein LOC128876750 [Hylaeus volcanicus]XP_053979358.1 uncharacterized protein LOC128876750 [Hylaeus volcanicus]
MTVMLLQRSVTPQSTHNQKTANKDCSAKQSFLFLLDDRPEHRHSTDTTTTITTNNNNNNNNNVNNNNNIIINNNNNNININNINNNVLKRDSSLSYVAEESVASVTSQRRADCGQDVAMRYYRLWIYTCNLVLLGSALGFAATVSRTLLFTGDPRRFVMPGVPRAFDPTALYAYLALATQLGLVQLLGCIAARRLSARLLNAYWVLLLALLFGDAVIGVAWVFRFERMRAELRPNLRQRLQIEYGKDLRFTEQWDRLQKEFMCCGVTGPRDFVSRWPQTCCGPSVNVSDACQQPFARGCEESLMRWLRKTADLLFVLGFCVIAFAKLCFLGILRYEIREMIQKIRLLREPPPPATTLAQSPFSQVMPEATNNGNIVRRTTLPNAVAPPGNASLLLQTEDCNTGRHPLLANNLQDGGADSDTNSHCALILEETTPTTANHTCGAAREKSNGNNNYEMREFNRRLLLSNGGSPGTGITAGGQSRRT